MNIQFYPDELDYVNAKLRRFGVQPPDENTTSQSFLGTFLLACMRADGENYEILRPSLQVMMKKYPADRLRLAMERHDSGRGTHQEEGEVDEETL